MPRKNQRGFTLLELLVAMAVMALLMVVIGSMFSAVSKSWKSSSGRAASFAAARAAFEAMSRNLSQATLATYLSYADSSGNPVPLINPSFKPGAVSSLVPTRSRYRLMEVAQPAERNGIYESTGQLDSSTGLAKYVYDLDWLKRLILTSPTASTPLEKQPLAENIISMALLPRLSPATSASLADRTKALAELTSDYSYDSRAWEPNSNKSEDSRHRNQLPPLIELVLVAIDEPSAQKLAQIYGGAGGSSPPFADGTVRGKVDLDALFKDPTKLEADILTLEDGLNKLQVSYRIFRTTVAMHGAKWTDR